MMALAAVPVVALLAGGGVAVAQAAGPHPGTAVVQLAAVHQPGDHGARDRICDRDRDRTCAQDRIGVRQDAGAGAGMTVRAHHGEHHGDR